MQVNPSSSLQIERKVSFPQHPSLLDTMFFELDNSGASVAAPPAIPISNKQNFTSRQIFIHPTPPLPSPSSSVPLNKNGRRIMHRHSHSASDSGGRSGRFAELAGGTTAECASVCCCCPYALVNILYLTIYKVPAGLCRRALRRKRMKQLIKKGLLPARTKRCRCAFDDSDILIYPPTAVHDLIDFRSDSEAEEEEDEEEEAIGKLEKEMWETFYSTGFWRSPSQKEDPHMASPMVNSLIDSI